MKALIMAGGQGTRFWPMSRELYPKQLLKLGDKHTLIQQTVLRLGPQVKAGDIHVITNDKLLVDIKSQLEEVKKGGLSENIIIEPEPKNTAPAIGLAALYMMKSDPKTVMAVLPSDHLIGDKKKFHAALGKASALASKGDLVVFGVRPTRPETGYGYIKLGKAISKDAHKVKRFVEKPDMNTAARYLAAGDYMWNSGIFVWKASAILDAIKKHMPALHKGLQKIDAAIGSDSERKVLAAEFKKLDADSIDYGVMEKADNVSVVTADFKWSDLGSWDALGEVIKPDKRGNLSVGRVIDIDCKDTTFYADERLVAAIGLTGMVIVDTPDATLVCRKDMVQRVKEVVGELKARGFEEYVTHKTVKRPWGSYTVLQQGPMYKIKRIEVKPGAKLSHQLHHHRSEHWVVVAGTALVTNGDVVQNVHVNESTYIPMSTKHRLENPGKVPLEIIEVQNGEYLEEDDIVRFGDEYGRE